jgi:hypothetical protein
MSRSRRARKAVPRCRAGSTGSEIPSNSAADDTSRETVTVIERFRFLHRAILSHESHNLTTPCRVGAARRRSRGHGPARLDGTRPRATVASKVMSSGETAGQATAIPLCRPHASEARRPGSRNTGRRRQRYGRRANASPVRDERIANLEQRGPAMPSGREMHDAITEIHRRYCALDNNSCRFRCRCAGERGNTATNAYFLM